MIILNISSDCGQAISASIPKDNVYGATILPYHINEYIGGLKSFNNYLNEIRNKL